MHTAIYQVLQQVAHEAGTITYAELAPLAEIDLSRADDRAALAAILDEINLHEHNEGRPMLSAVVVLAGRQAPGAGFFACAQRLARAVGADPQRFWQDELAAVYRTWPPTIPAKG